MRKTIPWAEPTFDGKEKRYLADALESSWISGGPYVERFEKRFTARHASPYGLTASNGTTALHMALLALGVGPGDEVIVPGFTFVAPGNMVLAVGAKPVFADIDAATWCLDPAAAAAAVTKRTKAIIAVHVYGNVCDMDALRKLSAKHKLALVEDTAEAAFSKYKGRYAGTMSDVGCFSFQATKTIAMGEGGFVLTPRKALWESMRVFREHGMRRGKRYWHDVVGYNFRLTNLQAAIGCAQLERVDALIAARRRVYREYRKRLSGIPGVTLQQFKPEVDPVVWAVAVTVDPGCLRGGREALIDRLAEAGIETRPGFYPFSVMPMYESRRLPRAEAVGLNAISFPSSPSVTPAQIGYICAQFQGALKRR